MAVQHPRLAGLRIEEDEGCRTAAVHVQDLRRAGRKQDVAEISKIRAETVARLASVKRKQIEIAAVSGKTERCARMDRFRIAVDERDTIGGDDRKAGMGMGDVSA